MQYACINRDTDICILIYKRYILGSYSKMVQGKIAMPLLDAFL